MGRQQKVPPVSGLFCCRVTAESPFGRRLRCSCSLRFVELVLVLLELTWCEQPEQLMRCFLLEGKFAQIHLQPSGSSSVFLCLHCCLLVCLHCCLLLCLHCCVHLCLHCCVHLWLHCCVHCCVHLWLHWSVRSYLQGCVHCNRLMAAPLAIHSVHLYALPF